MDHAQPSATEARLSRRYMAYVTSRLTVITSQLQVTTRETFTTWRLDKT